MTPQRATNGTLTDLLDRVLDKGLVIHADVIVSVAGIPLIGVNLRAALAGMETMLKYGVMQAWDERVRAWETDHRRKRQVALTQGEAVLLKTLGACFFKNGISPAWKHGHLYLTDKRLFLCHEIFSEVLFEIPLSKIEAIALGEQKRILYLLIEDEKVFRLKAQAVEQLKEALERRMARAGLAISETLLKEWERAIHEIIRRQEASLLAAETETCPHCGRRAPRHALLEKGCGRCGWIRPTKMNRVQEVEMIT